MYVRFGKIKRKNKKISTDRILPHTNFKMSFVSNEEQNDTEREYFCEEREIKKKYFVSGTGCCYVCYAAHGGGSGTTGKRRF